MSKAMEQNNSIRWVKDDKIFEMNDFSFSESNLSDYEFLVEYADEYNVSGLAIAKADDKSLYRHVIDRPAHPAMLILVCEFAERASYYGVTAVLTNFIQRPLPLGSTTGRVMPGDNGNAGALGLGLQKANALTMLLQFLAYVTPLYGGYIADDRLGKFEAIMVGVWIGVISHVLFVISAIPSIISKGNAALAPLVLGVVSLATCTGFIKPNLLPLLLDQYPYKTNVLKKLKTGEIVYVDRDGSIQRLTNFYFWAINFGAFLQIATSYAAKDVGYWLAFLCPGIMYFLVLLSMVLIKPYLKQEIPQGSLLKKALQVVRVCLNGNFIKRLREGTFWEYAYPENMIARGQPYLKGTKQKPIPWTKQEVRDYCTTFTQCLMFTFWIIFNLSDTGLGSTLTAQAGVMSSKGIPNDFFYNFNQIAIIVALSILDRIVYPLLAKYNINFKLVYRCFLGFMLAASASMVSAIIQWKIYKTSPCGYYATTCNEPSPLSAWLEIVNYSLCALAECFCFTSAFQLAYTRAPENGKGLVMALFFFNTAISAAISTAVSDALVDPHLIWPFAGIAIAGVICAIIFLLIYSNLDATIAEEIEEKQKFNKGSKEDNKRQP